MWKSFLASLLTLELPPLLAAALVLIPPAWLLALILSLINTFVFHIAVAADSHSPLFLAPFGLFGFALGNFVGWLIVLPLPTLGDIHVIEACAGAWLILVIANAIRAPVARI